MKNKIRYSTNWMGPISLNWYIDRGLTKKVIATFAGESQEVDEIIESYSGGRLDFWNPYSDSMFSDEIGVPPMRSEDWESLSRWLDTFETDQVLTLKEIVVEYEKTHPEIRWWKEKDENNE